MNHQPYELSKAAAKDLENVILYSLETHGAKQARKYSSTLLKCLDKLAEGDGQIRRILDIDERIRYLRCQHHYIFGIQRTEKSMVIVAILHERMDLINRIASRLR